MYVMKDNLLEMLLSLFKKTLTQLEESYVPGTPDETESTQKTDLQVTSSEGKKKSLEMMWLKSQDNNSIRVLTPDEQMKLTKASQQFIKRLTRLAVVAPDTMELIMNRLLFSESRFVNLQETKWTIRNTLSESLNAEQLAFLDLVLYQKEDEMTLH